MKYRMMIVALLLSTVAQAASVMGDAQWIGAPWETDVYENEAEHPTPEFRKSIFLVSKPKTATVYVTGLGMFEMQVNGKKVGEDYFTPNETMYGHRQKGGKFSIPLDDYNFSHFRVMYLRYDISDMFRSGDNTIGAVLGNGWWSTYRKGWIDAFGTPRFICRIVLEFANGKTMEIASDTSWEVRRSPIIFNDIYRGEIYDAREEANDDWQKAVVRKAPEGELVPQEGLEDRLQEVLEPKSITRLEDGNWEVDFGDYITGWVHLYGIKAKAGTEIEIVYPTDVEDHKSWRKPWNGQYKYICKGGKKESYAPRFNWYSFRKVIVKGWPGKLKAKNLKAEAIYTNIRTTGHFDCSNPLFAKINHLFWRAQTDNMHMGVATDCPHREKGPYTGDGQVACVAVMHNFDADNFYRKWLQDMADCQDKETGYVPNGAPWHPGCGGGVGWGAAMCIIPWEHYLHYGDKTVLERFYLNMKGQLQFMASWQTEEGIMNMQMPHGGKPLYWMNLGDWCAAYELPEDRLVHTYFLWKCAEYTSKAAQTIGKLEDAALYKNFAEEVRTAFHEVFYNAETHSYGKPGTGSDIFALAMSVPQERKAAVLQTLENEIRGNGCHINTGIFGTQLFFETLCANGLSELAYEVMNNRTQPSYGWWLEQGADTMWEYWNGTQSRNHPMFGGGLVWMYRNIAGFNSDPKEPGYKHIIIKPTPLNDLSWASYETETPQGKASVRWEKGSSGSLNLEVLVPKGSHATVYLQDGTAYRELGEGQHNLKWGN